MVLVDTSVWVEHFRKGQTGLESLLNEGQVASHPFIVGELAISGTGKPYFRSSVPFRERLSPSMKW